jgi:hypothetical protein
MSITSSITQLNHATTAAQHLLQPQESCFRQHEMFTDKSYILALENQLVMIPTPRQAMPVYICLCTT